MRSLWVDEWTGHVLVLAGDDPPRDRTAELRALGFPTRHLGPVQMTTDTALGVTKRVIVDRGSLVPHPPFFFPAMSNASDRGLLYSSARGDSIRRSSFPLMLMLVAAL
jgi:hypothetical protein